MYRAIWPLFNPSPGPITLTPRRYSRRQALLRSVSHPEGCLRRAAARGDEAAVAELLAAGADACATDPLQPGWSPLHVAVEHGHAAIAHQLLGAGAEPDACDELTGATPLLWACFRDQAACAKVILAHGSPDDPQWPQRHLKPDALGRTPLSLARQMQHEAVLDAIGLHQARVKVELKQARLLALSREDTRNKPHAPSPEHVGAGGGRPGNSKGKARPAFYRIDLQHSSDRLAR